MAPKHKKDQDTAFTNFTIKVDVTNNWTKTVEKVLNSVKGVRSFRMDDTGKVHVSGYVEPNALLKCLRKNGKDAHLVHWQYGECSSNLYQNSCNHSGGHQNGGYNNNGKGYNYNHQPLVTYAPSYPPSGDQNGGYNNNGKGYNYNHQPLLTYTPSYQPCGDPYANHDRCSIM